MPMIYRDVQFGGTVPESPAKFSNPDLSAYEMNNLDQTPMSVPQIDHKTWGIVVKLAILNLPNK